MRKFFSLIFIFTSAILTAQVDSSLISGPPVFHGPRVIGNYPNTPFEFMIPATGERPMRFEVEGLPKQLGIHKITGFIHGRIEAAGEYNVRITVSNRLGRDTEDVKIIIGDKLALSPPMGWNSWNVFTSDVNEQLVMEMADAMVSTGMVNLGYQYINIDDYWQAAQREADGSPRADSVKFPHGMKYLADYIHDKGLKLGIYSCAGDMTCGKKYGGYQHEEIDAQTYAKWGIDLLKYDYCFAPKAQKEALARYKKMGDALKASGRSIVYSVCEWGERKPWDWAAGAGGNYWRTTGDIIDGWDGNKGANDVMKILNAQKGLEKYGGPGHWNDPDMLIVGNHGKGKATGGNGAFKGMTQEEYHSHFALWCMLDAPLLSSCDLRTASREDLAILTDPLLIGISQDPLGEQAKLVSTSGGIWRYEKHLSGGRTAIALLNTNKEEKLVEKQNGYAGGKIKPHATVVFVTITKTK